VSKSLIDGRETNYDSTLMPQIMDTGLASAKSGRKKLMES
jgi:hypothetical protein